MICTSIEQSKHLLELGLDPKTADMFYFSYGMFRPMKLHVGKILEDVVTGKRQWAIPAWSLSALLEVMPMVDDGWPVLNKIYGSEKWHVIYHSTAERPKIEPGQHDLPIAAAYQMVCWLLEQRLIEKGGEK